jgi:hypothetical protein
VRFKNNFVFVALENTAALNQHKGDELPAISQLPAGVITLRVNLPGSPELIRS